MIMTNWEVSWWVEEKSYDDAPARDYEVSEVVSATTADAAYHIVRDRPHEMGKMRYGFRISPVN